MTDGEHTSRAQTVTEACAMIVKERCLEGGAIFLGPTPEECETHLVNDPPELHEEFRKARESGDYRFVIGAVRTVHKGNSAVLAWGYRYGDRVLARHMILLTRNHETWWGKSWTEPLETEAA